MENTSDSTVSKEKYDKIIAENEKIKTILKNFINKMNEFEGGEKHDA